MALVGDFGVGLTLYLLELLLRAEFLLPGEVLFSIDLKKITIRVELIIRNTQLLYRDIHIQ